MKRWPLPLVASFVLFLALCASLAYWALQFLAPAQRPVAAAPVAVVEPANLSAAASLFGGSGNTAVASNFTLQGVVLSGNAGQSIAILSANGEPAKAVAMGMEIVPGITVKEVHRGYVLLADEGALKRVELPLEPPLLGSSSAAPVATRPGDSPEASVNGASAPGPGAFGRRRTPSALQEQQAREAAAAPAPQTPQDAPSSAAPAAQNEAEAAGLSAAPVVSGQAPVDADAAPASGAP